MPRQQQVIANGGATLGSEFEQKLWEMADALRNNMDAAEYKHVVLGLIFLKYISDAFEEQHGRLEAEIGEGADPEDPDEYRAERVFWVPPDARWSRIQAEAPQPTIGERVDEAMAAIEAENASLKGVLPKDYARPGLDKEALGSLIRLVSDVEVGSDAARSQDVLGRVYEYFLSQFASAEGKKGGQFYTPQHRGPVARRDARTVRGSRVRPLLRLRRHVRAERALRRGARREHRRDQHLRPGVEPHDVAARQDEPRHPRH